MRTQWTLCIWCLVQFRRDEWSLMEMRRMLWKWFCGLMKLSLWSRCELERFISKMSYYVSDGTWKTYLLSHWILSHPVFIRCLLCLVPSVSCLVSLTGIYCTTHLFIHFRQCSQQTECSSMNSRDWEVYNYSFHSRGAYLSPWLTVTIWFASGCHLRNNSHENCLLWAPGL